MANILVNIINSALKYMISISERFYRYVHIKM